MTVYPGGVSQAHGDIKAPCLVGIRSVLVGKNKPNFWGDLKRGRQADIALPPCIWLAQVLRHPERNSRTLAAIFRGSHTSFVTTRGDGPVPLIQRAEPGHRAIGSPGSRLLGFMGGDEQLKGTPREPLRKSGIKGRKILIKYMHTYI